MQSAIARDTIAALGTNLGPHISAACAELFAQEQQALALRVPCTAADRAYGAHERQRLDIYAPADQNAGTARPVMLFVPGGGFLRGDKGSAGDWKNANVGRMAAAAGFVGAVMNYRLAPDHRWPAGGEDVGAAVDWLAAHVQDHGGDPERLVLAGTSAGSVHIATHLRHRDKSPGVRAAVLLSGLYGVTPLAERDSLYYGDPDLYPERRPLEAVTGTALPLLVACAEFDPPRFQAETLGLLERRLASKGRMPRSCILSGHNHYSMSMHLGTSDTRLADEILAFAREHCA